MANYKITDLSGVSEVYGQKLCDAGIKDTDSLLAACTTTKDRETLASKADVSSARLLKWANMADLYRIKGIGSEFSELLEAAGVDTVPDLARRNAANLTAAMEEVNEAKKLTRRTPKETEVANWIEQAKQLPRMLHY